MIILDTDHISILQHADSPIAQSLSERLANSPDRDVTTTAISLEEQSRSWLSLISRYSDVRRQVTYYDRFVATCRFFAKWRVVPFDDRAAEQFQQLRAARVRIAATDLKIASICQVNSATLLSRNLRDFRKVPGLHVEDWLSE
jgi:tRNA(fMet)-specific endonuclease VapC